MFAIPQLSTMCSVTIPPRIPDTVLILLGLLLAALIVPVVAVVLV